MPFQRLSATCASGNVTIGHFCPACLLRGEVSIARRSIFKALPGTHHLPTHSPGAKDIYHDSRSEVGLIPEESDNAGHKTSCATSSCATMGLSQYGAIWTSARAPNKRFEALSNPT